MLPLFLTMCRCGDLAPAGLRHLLLTYLKSVRNTPAAHEDARKQLYRRLYGILWVNLRKLHSDNSPAFYFTIYFCCAVWVTEVNWSGLWSPSHIRIPRGTKKFCEDKVSKRIKKHNDPKGNQVQFTVLWVYSHTLSNSCYYAGLLRNLQRPQQGTLASST